MLSPCLIDRLDLPDLHMSRDLKWVNKTLSPIPAPYGQKGLQLWFIIMQFMAVQIVQRIKLYPSILCQSGQNLSFLSLPSDQKLKEVRF